jgi:hypothetical protein
MKLKPVRFISEEEAHQAKCDLITLSAGLAPIFIVNVNHRWQLQVYCINPFTNKCEAHYLSCYVYDQLCKQMKEQ